MNRNIFCLIKKKKNWFSFFKAVENGVYVVGACGFDSIPADMGQVKHQKGKQIKTFSKSYLAAKAINHYLTILFVYI